MSNLNHILKSYTYHLNLYDFKVQSSDPFCAVHAHNTHKGAYISIKCFMHCYHRVCHVMQGMCVFATHQK